MRKDNISIPLPGELALSGAVILFVKASQTNRGIVTVVSVCTVFQNHIQNEIRKILKHTWKT